MPANRNPNPNPNPWTESLAASADPRRATLQFKLLHDSGGAPYLDALAPDPEARRILAAVLAGSRALCELMAKDPRHLTVFQVPETLHHPRRSDGLSREIGEILDTSLAAGDYTTALDALHHFRLREQLRIAARDLARLGRLPEIMLEISNAADAFLEGVLRVVWSQLTERFGRPWHTNPDGAWQETAFSILGLGKLGGQELNYSSDVDLLFVYAEEGSTHRTPPSRRKPTPQGLTNHQFFKRLGEALIREGSARGVEAGGLRIDMRLRPEGDAGPLARSIDSYENFYAAWGQTWERMMLLKARRVAGHGDLAGEFLERIHPFRYPRSISEGLLHEMAEMKARTEREIVRAGEIDRNVKLGRGGIREIEFIAQSLQVLHGGRNPFLQTSQTLAALPKLAAYGHLADTDVHDLACAYPFLRDIEHRLQMEDLQQTHTLPPDPPSLERIARLMGFPALPPFQEALHHHTTRVRSIYNLTLGSTTDPDPTTAANTQPNAGSRLPPDFDDPNPWQDLLLHHGFRDPDKGTRLLREFVHGPGFVHVSRRTTDLARQLIPRLLELCPHPHPSRSQSCQPPPDNPGSTFVLSDPDRVLARIDTYIHAYGTRAALYELWTSRPAVFEHILKLFDRSEFLAELAIRTPDLVDDLEAGSHLRRQKTAAQTLEDLRHGHPDPDQHLWLRRYFQTEFMRLGLRDILGYVDDLAANAELTALAEACIQYALEVVTRRHRLKSPPLAVIGLGKLGGRELVYGSDLDLIFVAPDRTRNLPRLHKIAAAVIDLLSARTELGSVFILDTRLRPDGDKGLLVNTLRAHEDYYRQRAMLWEIQALTRARAVAGDPATGSAFQSLARRLTDFRHPPSPLAAATPDWRSQIDRMRGRIETERTPKGLEHLAFKTGAGGLIDAEFVAQTLAMAHGTFEPNTLRSLELLADSGALPADDAASLILHFRRLRRMESILRRWSFEGETALPEDPAAQRRVAIRCGYPDTPPFLDDLAHWRSAIRAVYRRVFPA